MILAINLIAAAIILIYGLAAINKMGWRTCYGMRAAWLVLTTGALGVLISPIYGHQYFGLWETALNVGIALHVVFERRRSRDERGAI